jgi:hypothetical protein
MTQSHNKALLPDWFSAALQTSRKARRYVPNGRRDHDINVIFQIPQVNNQRSYTMKIEIAGNTITQSENGDFVIKHVSGGEILPQSDGSFIFNRKDGSVVISYPNGSLNTAYPDGTQLFIGPDGSSKFFKDGQLIAQRSPSGEILEA